MSVVCWIVEGTWPACVDAARALAPADADVVLLHVIGPEVPAVAHGAYAGLLGRGHRGGPTDEDPGGRVSELAAAAAERLLDAAAQRLGRPARRVTTHGRVERAVVAAAEHADLLVVARDGDRGRLGPRSLGPHSRFVVDHAPCPVLLVWPEQAPDITSVPPPPHR
ncbi:MAG TPA: universal stress protein [Pseudonocardiaceae bacterium]|jgi:nucleotide-binding universal stress UspA family protein|nr:universal stress protein [Pseudonocardiaceae bacterium]